MTAVALQDGMAEAWMRHEDAILANAKGQQIVRVAGRRRCLLSAPHAVNHWRAGEEKRADLHTGGLALALAGEMECSAVVSVAPGPTDPNWDGRETDYYRALMAMPVATVLDLHGMRDGLGSDICLALGECPSKRVIALARRLAAAGQRLGLEVTINHPFRAHAPALTSLLQADGRDALELEIARRFRDPDAFPDLARTLAVFLRTAVRLASA